MAAGGGAGELAAGLDRAGERPDGRHKGAARRAGAELGAQAHAAGAARGRLGGSRALAAVSLELVEPEGFRPRGPAVLSVEASAPLAPAGPPGGGGARRGAGGGGPAGGVPARAARAARLVAAGLRGFHAYGDGAGAPRGGVAGGGPARVPGPLGGERNPGLAPAPGRAVWGLRVDCAVESDAGGLAACLSRSAKAALLDARIPRATVEEVAPGTGGGDDDAAAGAEVEVEVEVDDDPGTRWRLDCSGVPVLVEVGMLGGRPLVDPTLEEEALCEGVLEACVGESGGLGPVALRGRGALEPGALVAALEAACAAGADAQRELNAEASEQRAARDAREAEMAA